MNWRAFVVRLMRVPHEPAPPPGSASRTFRAAPAYLKLRILGWVLMQIVAVGGLVFAVVSINLADEHFPRWLSLALTVGEVFGALAIAAEVIFGWMIVQLDYELRWYMLSDRAIRIREGITTVREKTIALANIQNIAVRQGPLQRYFGISDVEVKTAGGGGQSADFDQKKKQGEPMHVGYFRGVSNAEEIRELLLAGVRRQRDSGLGDPDEPQHAAPVSDGNAIAAAAELLGEARRLRAAVAAR